MSLEPLGEEEFAEIDDLLLSEGLPESTMDVCAAEGFLTAIAIGPAPTVIHAYWLPYREATGTNPRRSKAIPAKATVGRNEPCPCDSGMKYKYCCGRPQTLP